MSQTEKRRRTWKLLSQKPRDPEENNYIQTTKCSYQVNKLINAQNIYFVSHQMEKRTFQSFNFLYFVTQVPPTAKIAQNHTKGIDQEPSVSGVTSDNVKNPM